VVRNDADWPQRVVITGSAPPIIIPGVVGPQHRQAGSRTGRSGH
jgi:hypothetical protein